MFKFLLYALQFHHASTMTYSNICTSIQPYKGINKNTMISIWPPCLNFAIWRVTCSLVHRIWCTPGYSNRFNFLHCSTSLHPETCLFINHSDFNTCIMETYLCFPSFLCYCIGHNLWFVHYGFSARLAVLAGTLLTLFFAWNITQCVWSQSVMTTLWSSDTLQSTVGAIMS